MKDEVREAKTLSAQEKKRLEKYNKTKEQLVKDGYEEHNLTVSLTFGNTVSMLTCIPFIVIFLLLFWLMGNSFSIKEPDPGWLMLVIILAVLFAGTVVHELLHGVTYAIFAKNHFKDIEFGFIKESSNPYCVCNVPLKKYQYLMGIFMPCFVLGIIPCLISLITGSFGWMLVGFFNILGASGDLLIMLLILTRPSKKKDVIYHDHPTEIGVVMFDK